MRAGISAIAATATCILALIGMTASALAEPRVALLIGNQGYRENVGPLRNPHNDIALVRGALEKLGFQVTVVKDADYRSLDTAIKRHIMAVRREGRGAISFVYYSGHGAADPDTKINYLIPVDVPNADDDDLWTNSLNLNNVIEGLRAQASQATHYIVFDACRNELNLTRKRQKALADKGFVPIAYTQGVMVAYSTAPGQTATDVGTSGGPYAKALADELVKPGVEAMTMFRHVALRVYRETGQDPWMSASTLPEVYFAGELSSPKPVAMPSPQQTSEAAQAWMQAMNTTKESILEAYIKQFGDTVYGAMARARLEDLGKSQITNAASLEQSPRTRSDKAGVQHAASEPSMTIQAPPPVEPKIELNGPPQPPGALDKATLEPITNSATSAAPSTQSKLEPTVGVLSAPNPDVTGVTRALQLELKRVGCDPGEADGIWHNSSRDALESFNKHASTQFDVKLASIDALEAVRHRTSRVCPPVCGRGFRAEHGQCIEIVCKVGFALATDGSCRKIKSPTTPSSPPNSAHQSGGGGKEQSGSSHKTLPDPATVRAKCEAQVDRIWPGAAGRPEGSPKTRMLQTCIANGGKF